MIKMYSVLYSVFTVIFISLISTMVFAGTPDVKIDSFVRVGPYLGEVCGFVTNNDNTSYRLNVTADPNTSSPGEYHVMTGLNGQYCELIHTNSGSVNVSLMGAFPAVSAEAKMRPTDSHPGSR